MEGVFAPGEWEKLYRHFGEDVAGKVRDGLARYGRRWGLRDLRFIPYYSVNCLFTACSGQYGDVVLKLGPVCPEMLTECAALRDFDGRGFCRCFRYSGDRAHPGGGRADFAADRPEAGGKG